MPQCCMRLWCLDAAGRACGAGPAAAETTAGLAGMHCGMRKRLRLMRCVLRTVRNDAHPRTFRTLADLDYRNTPRLNCRDAPPLEYSVHCIRSHELPVSMHMHCTQLVMSLNTIYQLVFWSVSQTPLPALSSSGPFEATSLCARARA